jgi:hypothetical protein
MRALVFSAAVCLVLLGCDRLIPPGEEKPPSVPDPVDEPGGGESEPPPTGDDVDPAPNSSAISGMMN